MAQVSEQVRKQVAAEREAQREAKKAEAAFWQNQQAGFAALLMQAS